MSRCREFVPRCPMPWRMPWRMPWWMLAGLYLMCVSFMDLWASISLDQMCMESGLLGKWWKNKHCNNAAKDLENGPFALLDLAFNRMTEWRFVTCCVAYLSWRLSRQAAIVITNRRKPLVQLEDDF